MNISSMLNKRNNREPPTPDEDFKLIENPYIVGNPIKSTEMFFGRENDFKHIQNWIVTDGPHVILLIGGRRSGKTSILWQILAGRLHHAGEAVLCDFHKLVPRIKQDEDFPFEVGQAILENSQFEQFKTEFLKDDNSSWTVRLEELVQNCLKLIKPRKLIILCDEFEAIEELFKSQLLSSDALLWVKQILNLPVHFVITGSQEFKNDIVSQVFGPVAQIYPIYELSQQDALALIQNPIGENLIYKEEVSEIIYRLSGGHPFYTQYICHTLVNHVNAELKRHYVVADDLDGVIDFIVRNPNGHIQETWRSFSNLDTAPKYGRETLAALANTIRHSNGYISTSKILKTVGKKRFKVDKQALYETLAWIIQNHRLLERNSGNYRFRTDLIRHWIAYEFQTGEDIEPLVGGSVVPSNQTKTYTHPKPETDEETTNWIQKYKDSCSRIKDNYPNGVPKNELKTLHDTYISNGRITESQAKEIEKLYKINSSKNSLWVASITIVIVIFLGIAWIWSENKKTPKPAIDKSSQVEKTGTQSSNTSVDDNADHENDESSNGGTAEPDNADKENEGSSSIETNPIDEIEPTGKIIGINSSYREGDEVNYSIEGSDNKALSSITFSVEDSTVKQTWEVSSKEINKLSSFSTKGWQAQNSYKYLLRIVDKGGNTFEKEGSFLLEGKAMSRLLISTIPSDTMISFLNAKTIFPQKQEVSTLQKIELPAGKYHIEISKPRYKSVKKWITLENGEDFQLEISLSLSNILQDDILGLVFVWIPNCEFTSFDFDDINNCTSGFWMSQTEISQKQWMQVMKSPNPSYFQKGDTYPVENINWQDAKAFAARVNKRLCSSQEWQKAFRYLKKDVVLDNAILGKKINAGPEPVDSFGDKSELGVLNMIGNVSELLDNNGHAAFSGLYWADIKTNSNFKRANQISTVFSLFKSSRIGLRLCITQ